MSKQGVAFKYLYSDSSGSESIGRCSGLEHRAQTY